MPRVSARLSNLDGQNGNATSVDPGDVSANQDYNTYFPRIGLVVDAYRLALPSPAETGRLTDHRGQLQSGQRGSRDLLTRTSPRGEAVWPRTPLPRFRVRPDRSVRRSTQRSGHVLLISKPLSRLGSAMRTTGPTTGLSFAFSQLRTHSPDMFGPRLRLLDNGDPADPLVALEWRKVIPLREEIHVRHQGLSQVVGNFVHRTSGDLCDLLDAA